LLTLAMLTLMLQAAQRQLLALLKYHTTITIINITHQKIV